ncbi:cytochrome P450 [Echria macrotheca]|uniref:Cytochrome P450 n=1 Tax=Echria macrotheca TaxID=438768 RepID=A0AAJ0F6P0_9PEZI|nr:cytochrome P450 [Echria macrotheca]
MPADVDISDLAEAAKALLLRLAAQPVLWTVGALTVLYVLHSIYIYTRLRQFPGPFLAGWTRLPLIKWHVGGKAHLELQRISETYGPLARIAPSVLVTSDPELLRRMTAARSRYKRSSWYMAFRFIPDRDNIVSVRDNDAHAQLKMKLAPGYSGKDTVGVEEKIDDNIRALISLFKEKYLSGPGETNLFDLAQKMQYFTADTISDISFGKPIGFLANDADMYDYLKTSADSFPFLIVLSLFPWLMHVMALGPIKKYMPSAKDSLGMGRIMGLAEEVVEKRYPPKVNDVHQDMLGSFIRHGLTKDEAKSESLLQLLAGSETTATTLRMILFHVYVNPRILFKLREELRQARPGSPITHAEASKLPYLQAVIKEGLRIYPSITGVMLKDVPPEGDTYQGKFIPGGTAIGYSVMGLFMNKAIWGEDAATFRPERFLEGTKEELQERDVTIDGAFGWGRWKCLGRGIALMELNKLVVEIIRTFDLSVVYPTHPFKNYNAGIQVQWDMWMRATLTEQKF